MDSPQLPIDSGSTGEWRLRIGIFLVMCTAFSVWFAYDGLIGYPRKNLESIRQALPEKPPTLQINPKVTGEHLNAVIEKASTGNLNLDGLIAILGEPALDLPREQTYVGPEIVAIARLADRKLIGITTQPVEESRKPETPNYRVTAEQVGRTSPGMSEQEVERFLGTPNKREPRRLWFAGPAAYAMFEVDDAGNLTGKPNLRNLEPSEGDIFIQKVLAIILGILSVFVLVKWLRILSLRVRVDESGLIFNRRHIPWDAMTGLDTDQYLDKGWVDLVYTEGGREELQRLDSYHIARFKEVVQAVCDRKGFTLPRPSEAKTAEADSDSDVV